MALKLEHREWKPERGGEPLVLLHGLLGSSRNWATAGQALCRAGFHVYALDLRNHGSSPHDPVHDYPSMVEDVLAWLDAQQLLKVNLLGHSMGGKVAMQLACQASERVRMLFVVDISIREYPPRWEREFETMQAAPVLEAKSRGEIEQFLGEVITDWAFRKFLVSNLERNRDGEGFRWSINLGVLQAALPDLFSRVPEEGEIFFGPTRFIRGGRSRFLANEDWPAIQEVFPQSRLFTVKEAGHNVHFDQLVRFVEAVTAEREFTGNEVVL